MKLSWQKKGFQVGTEYQHVPTLRIMYILLVSLLFCALVFSVWFVYRSVFIKIEEANTIILLRSETGVETLEFDLFQTVQKTEKARMDAPFQGIDRNPFVVPSLLPNTILETESEI